MGAVYRQEDLRRDTDALGELGITGVQARVTTAPGQDLVATTGVAVAGTNRPVPRNGYLRIAGTGKAFMAAVILQLVDEGEVPLETRWIAGCPG
ncbi:serine hydrolase [Streptomyces sp. NPDC041068]|uniref:serine hydrolase n=1 Tax=Streptomyces sp. NPDC041068 TaxID=3155130 RepID=UPI0033DE601B